MIMRTGRDKIIYNCDYLFTLILKYKIYRKNRPKPNLRKLSHGKERKSRD